METENATTCEVSAQIKAAPKTMLPWDPVTDGVSPERIAEVDSILLQSNVSNRKKRKLLMLMSDESFSSFKLASTVARCCREMDIDTAFAAYLDYKQKHAPYTAVPSSSSSSLDEEEGTGGGDGEGEGEVEGDVGGGDKFAGKRKRDSNNQHDNKGEASTKHEETLSRGSLPPTHETFTNLLSLTAGLGDQGMSLAPPRQVEPPHNIEAALVVFDDMKAANVPFNEASYTAMIRCCCINDRPQRALSLYHEMQALDLTPKLRTLCPLLAAFAKEGNDDVCFKIFHELVHRYNLQPTEREYLSMLKLTLNSKDQRFHQILDNLSEDVLVPTRDVWQLVSAWFSTVEEGYVVCESDVCPQGLVASNGAQLRSVDLCEETRKALMAQVHQFATAGIVRVSENSATTTTTTTTATEVSVGGEGEGGGEGGVKHNKEDNKDGNKETNNQGSNGHANNGKSSKKRRKIVNQRGGDVERREKWASFIRWLEDKVGVDGKPPRFDVVVDGANVGYFKQNFAGAPSHVDYNQVDWMVRQLIQRGCSPLVVLHCRHLYPNVVPKECAHIVKAWEKEGLLLSTPAGCNDDWFWLYAAVAMNCQVVTNDEMRDHHFQMLSPRWFCRWKERKQIHFTFGAWSNRQQHVTNENTTNALTSAASSSSSSIPPTHIVLEQQMQRQALFGNTNNPTDVSISTVPSTSQSEDKDNTRQQPSGGGRWRTAVLVIPAPYSTRIQRVGDGVYVPCKTSDKWLCCYKSKQ